MLSEVDQGRDALGGVDVLLHQVLHDLAHGGLFLHVPDDLPGGEAVPYREMVRRVLACLQPPLPLVELPMPLFRLSVRAAQARGLALELTDAAVQRMREDLVFDPEPARRDFGYAPRPFKPEPRMLEPRG